VVLHFRSLSQNKSPLSFDTENIPFDVTVKYIFKPDEYYSKYAYEEIKSIYNIEPSIKFRLGLSVYGSSNESNFFSVKDTTPYAEQATFRGILSSSNVVFSYLYHHRAFHYFSTSKKKGGKEDVIIYGGLSSGIHALMLGYEFRWASLFVSWDHLFISHKFDDNFKLLDNNEKFLYSLRYNEVHARLQEYGFQPAGGEEIKQRLSLFFYSKPLSTGGVISSNYLYLDHTFSSLCNIQRRLELGNLGDFSQIDIHCIDIIQMVTGIKLRPLLTYDLRLNFNQQFFKNYIGAQSNLELMLNLISRSESGFIEIGYKGKLLFDHSFNVIAYQRNELHLKFFWGKDMKGASAGVIVAWGSVHPRIFIPDPNQLYRNEIWISGYIEHNILWK
jgi:hypothetical protein